MQYCFIPLVTLLALEKLVPANLVDRTVQQAGKHRNREQPQKHWKNNKNKKLTQCLSQSWASIGLFSLFLFFPERLSVGSFQTKKLR